MDKDDDGGVEHIEHKRKVSEKIQDVLKVCNELHKDVQDQYIQRPKLRIPADPYRIANSH